MESEENLRIDYSYSGWDRIKT